MRKTLTIWSKNYNGVSRIALVNGYFVYAKIRMIKGPRGNFGVQAAGSFSLSPGKLSKLKERF
jgi:hypothetical protein